MNNSVNYEMSEWHREKDRRRQELLAKRSKVMNRLLELRLEKEGEGADTRENREKLNRLLEMRLEQEGVPIGSMDKEEEGFGRNQRTENSRGYGDDGFRNQPMINSSNRHWQNGHNSHSVRHFEPPNGISSTALRPNGFSSQQFHQNGGMGQESEFQRTDNYNFSNPNNDVLLESERPGHSRNFDRNGIQCLNSRPISNDGFRGLSNNQQNDEYISNPHQRGFNSNQRYIRDRNNSNQFRNQEARQGSFALVKSTGPDHVDLQQEKCTTNSRAPSLAPELSMPVYQTLEKKDDAWDGKKRVEDAGAVDRAARQEEWAWGTGSKWLGAPAEKPKLNLHAGPPRAEMFENAPKVKRRR